MLHNYYSYHVPFSETCSVNSSFGLIYLLDEKSVTLVLVVSQTMSLSHHKRVKLV